MRSGGRYLVVIGALLATACAVAPVSPVIEAPLSAPPAQQVPSDPNAWPAVRSRVALDPAIEARIDSILARMPLEEKVAQTVQPDISSVTPDDVRRYKFGSILAGGNSSPAANRPDETRYLIWLTI